MTSSHDELRNALGAYVLNHLDDDLRHEVEQHLATCTECRAEVAELDWLAEALRGVDRDWVDTAGGGPPAALDERIRLAITDPPRTGRWLPAGIAVAAAAIAVAVTLGVVQDDAPSVITVPTVQVADGVTATAGLVDHTWGLEIKLEATGLRAGERFQVWVTGEDGQSYDAGQILGVAGTKITCGMSSSVPLEEARSFRVVDAEGIEIIAAALPHPA